MSDDEDLPQLSASTFAALQEFYGEQQDKEKRLQDLSDETNIDENWQLSQFWYDDATIDKLVTITLKTVENKGKVALVSCPSLYKKLKAEISVDSEVTLFEYDVRFACYGADFVLYDYKTPLDIPRDKASYFDLVIADPPFLSNECLTKTAVTIKFLTKHKIILCTGAIMADMADKLLQLKSTNFHPKHRNNLANEFCCFTNYSIDNFI